MYQTRTEGFMGGRKMGKSRGMLRQELGLYQGDLKMRSFYENFGGV